MGWTCGGSTSVNCEPPHIMLWQENLAFMYCDQPKCSCDYTNRKFDLKLSEDGLLLRLELCVYYNIIM